jgi:lysophospholipase L1-like esterase
VLQIGPALLHLARQCSVDAAAGFNQHSQEAMQRMLGNFGELLSQLASAAAVPAGDACTISLCYASGCVQLLVGQLPQLTVS